MNVNLSQVRSFFVKGVALAKNTNPKKLGCSAVIVALIVGLALKVFDKMKRKSFMDKFKYLTLEADTCAINDDKFKEKDRNKFIININISLCNSDIRKNPRAHYEALNERAKFIKENCTTKKCASYQKILEAEALFFKTYASDISELSKLNF